jgi:hypothetical protein
MKVWRNRIAYIDFLHDGSLSATSEALWVPDVGSPVQIGTFDGTLNKLESFSYDEWDSNGVVQIKIVAGAVYATIDIEVEDACEPLIHLLWLNDLGGLSQWVFGDDQILSVNPTEDGQFLIYTVIVRAITEDEWLRLQSLNKLGAEYGDNQKLGAFVQDITDVDNPINVFVMFQPILTRTRESKKDFQIDLRYPLIENISV